MSVLRPGPRRLVALLVVASLALLAEPARAQKGGRSSSSSGGSRSSSSSSSRSFSGGSRSSSGSGSRSSGFSSPGRSGSASSSSSSRAKPTFSGGSKPASKPPAASSKPTFSGGSTNPKAPAKPSSSSSFGAGAARAQAQTRAAPRAEPGVAANKPASTKPAPGTSRTATATAARTKPASTKPAPKVAAAAAVKVRPEHAATRAVRVQKTYVTNHYGGWSSHAYQSDSFHPMLTGYLLARLTEPRYSSHTSLWLYHHWDELDRVRQDELLRENGALRAQLAGYRDGGVARDPGYALAGVDSDLLYNDRAAGELYRPRRVWPRWLTISLVTLAAVGLAAALASWYLLRRGTR